MTEVLTKGDKEVVDDEPVLVRQLRPQGKLGFFGIPGSDVSPTITDAMNMGVDTDSRFSVTKGYSQIGSFAPHPLEFK